MFTNTCTYKVIRVPTGVETGTDVPARGNGLISCRHIPPGDPLLLRNIIPCDNGRGRAQSRRMNCELSTHNKSKTLVLSRHPARRKDAFSALVSVAQNKCLCSALGTDAFARARLLTPTYKCKKHIGRGGVGGHRSDVFEFCVGRATNSCSRPYVARSTLLPPRDATFPKGGSRSALKLVKLSQRTGPTRTTRTWTAPKKKPRAQ